MKLINELNCSLAEFLIVDKRRLEKNGRPQYSLFRYGLDLIVEALIQRGSKLKRLTTLLIRLLRLNINHHTNKGILVC